MISGIAQLTVTFVFVLFAPFRGYFWSVFVVLPFFSVFFAALRHPLTPMPWAENLCYETGK
jgi:hypothetical protein